MHTCASTLFMLYCIRGDTMGKTSSASKNKYNEKAYDRLFIHVSKGQKEAIRDFAAARGESLNGFINRAIAEAMEREQAQEGGK